MPPKGYKQSQEAIAKMRAAKLGSNNPMSGRGHTEESKKKIREAKIGNKNGFYGKHHSEITKQRKRDAIIGDNNPMKRPEVSAKHAGANNHNYGKPLPEETKQKLRDALSGEKNAAFGKHRSQETKAKISAAHKGKTFTEPYRKKLIEAKYGGFWYGNIRYYEGPQYCEKWTGSLRERVRAYFGYKCVECGAPQNGSKLAVHHVHYNKLLCCDDTPRMLVALCQSCHAKTNFDREYWSDHFQEIIDEQYNGKCWFTKEEYANMLKETNND